LSCCLPAPFSCHSKSLSFKFFLLNFLSDDAQDDLVSVQSAFTNSVIDLSRATSIETLTITEGDYVGLEDQHVDVPGTLTVTGIRNGAKTTLDGNFLNNLKLNYGELQGAGVNLVFNNLSMEDTTVGSGGDNVPLLKVAHNAETLNIASTGGGNYLHNADLGGQLRVINISGNAHPRLPKIISFKKSA
jgi:hypothetical protein